MPMSSEEDAELSQFLGVHILLALQCICLSLQVRRKKQRDRMWLSYILTFSKHESELIAQPASSCFHD